MIHTNLKPGSEGETSRAARETQTPGAGSETEQQTKLWKTETRAGVPKNELEDHECSICGELKNRALQTATGLKHSGDKIKNKNGSCLRPVQQAKKNRNLDRNTSSSKQSWTAPSTRKR
jgi:hypothetical protein